MGYVLPFPYSLVVKPCDGRCPEGYMLVKYNVCINNVCREEEACIPMLQETKVYAYTGAKEYVVPPSTDGWLLGTSD